MSNHYRSGTSPLPLRLTKTPGTPDQMSLGYTHNSKTQRTQQAAPSHRAHPTSTEGTSQRQRAKGKDFSLPNPKIPSKHSPKLNHRPFRPCSGPAIPYKNPNPPQAHPQNPLKTQIRIPAQKRPRKRVQLPQKFRKTEPKPPPKFRIQRPKKWV
jgi:hypothetical protein